MTPGYEVPLSGAIQELLFRLLNKADADGRRFEFLAAFKAVAQRLCTEPETFGEEVFDLAALHLTIKVGVILPLVVEFGVHSEKRLVIIRTFRYV